MLSSSLPTATQLGAELLDLQTDFKPLGCKDGARRKEVEERVIEIFNFGDYQVNLAIRQFMDDGTRGSSRLHEVI